MKNSCGGLSCPRQGSVPPAGKQKTKPLLREHAGDERSLGKEVRWWNSLWIYFNTQKKLKMLGVKRHSGVMCGGWWLAGLEGWTKTGTNRKCEVRVGQILVPTMSILKWRRSGYQGDLHMGIFLFRSLWCSHKYSTFSDSTCSWTSYFKRGQ